MAQISPAVQKFIQIPLCRGLSHAEADVLFGIAEETSVPQGEVLFREGAPGDAFYAVLEGHMAITKRDPNGEEHVLAEIAEGSVLGEMALIGGTAQRSATATAVSDARLLKIPAERFARLLQSDNMAALKIVHNLAQVMGKRLQLMNVKLVETADKTRKKEELQEFQKLLNNWSF